MKLPGGGRALLFEKSAVNRDVSPFPVVINLRFVAQGWSWAR